MKCLKLYSFLFLLMFANQYLYGQNTCAIATLDTSNYKYWITAGFRLNMIDDAGINLSYNFGFDKVFIQTLYSIQKFPKNSRTMQASIGSVSIGSKFKKRYYLVAAFVGPSVVFGEKIISETNTKYTTLGLNINIQVFFNPLSELGIGIELINNLNNISSFSFLHFSISINNIN